MEYTRQKLKNLLLCLCTLVTICSSSAQGVSTIPIALIDESSGLENLHNYNCFKDSRGFVWISSFAGLYRFDGAKMKAYLPDEQDSTSIPAKYIHSKFVEDKDGNLWFGTFRNITCYRRNNDQFISFGVTNSTKKANYYVSGIDSLGQLWFEHDTAIYTFHTGDSIITWQASIPKESWRTEIQLDAKGRVKYTYTFTAEANKPGIFICEFENSMFKSDVAILDQNPTRYVVRDVHFIGDSITLVATKNGLYHYYPRSRELHLVRPIGATMEWNCKSITSWGDSLVLLGSYPNGYFLYDAQRQAVIRQYRIAFQGQVINDIPIESHTDADGGIWVHLYAKGYAYFHPDNLIFDHYDGEILTEGKSIPFKVGGLAETSRGKVLATSETIGGYFVDEVDGDISGSPVKCESCPRVVLRSLKTSDGALWLSDGLRLYRMADGEPVSVVEPPGRTAFRKHLAEYDGHLLSTLLDGTLGKLSDTENPDFSLLDVPAKYHFDLIGVHPNGFVYVASDLQFIHQFDLGNSTSPIRSIPFKYMINCFEPVEDTDDFIIGTNRGAYYYDARADSLTLIDYCDSGYDNMVFGVIPLTQSQYLMSADNGACVVDINTKESSYYGSEHGLGPTTFNRFAYMKHSSGKIWLGTNTGIAVTDPGRLQLPDLTPEVNITRIKVNDLSSAGDYAKGLTTLNDSEIKDLHLPHRANTLTFEFGALSYAGIGHHEYEYRMDGLESDWVDCGKLGFARYSNLPARRMTFEVRIKGDTGSKRTVKVSIAPPFYARGWFITTVVLILLMSIYFTARVIERRKQRILQLRTEKELAVQQERLRISNDLHDDLGSGLSALTLKARVLRDKTTDNDLKARLDSIVISAEELADKARESIWVTSSTNDTLEKLLVQLHEYSSTYLTPTRLDFTVELPPSIPKVQVPGEHRRHLYMAFKESLHNGYKHGNASRIQVSFTADSGELRIYVTDDGQGFNVSLDSANGHGLGSMKHRMEAVGGSFLIDSSNTGTSVELRYPLNILPA